MKRTGLKFTWNSGSFTDNAIKILKENSIDWHYDHFFNLVADFYGTGLFQKVDYEHIENDDFEICLACKSNYETEKKYRKRGVKQ